MNDAIRCGTKGCPNEPTERVLDSKLPHVIYDLCASCAAGMRLLQSMPEGALIDAQDVPPLTFEPVAATAPDNPLATWRRFYNMARHPSYEGYVGLTQERAEFYADRLYHEYVNRGDFQAVSAALSAELREWNHVAA